MCELRTIKSARRNPITYTKENSKMSTCTLKFEATAFRENDDNELESLSASISVPVENDDEVIGNTLGEEKLIVHAVAALYNLISDLRPNWLDNEDTSLTLDISIDGRKAQSHGSSTMFRSYATKRSLTFLA